MKFYCPDEEKISGLIHEGRWSRDSDPALIAHAEKCSRCGETVSMIQQLQHNRTTAMLSAHTGSPGYLWWRAQLRRRSGAVEKMAKPFMWAEGFTLVSMVAIAAGFALLQWNEVRGWLSGLTGISSFQSIDLSSTSSVIAISMFAGLAVIAGIGGLTLFFSETKE
jgi:hypothetical protein